MWGILRSLDDILVALFNASSALPYAIATLVHLSFFSAYLLFSIPAGISSSSPWISEGYPHGPAVDGGRIRRVCGRRYRALVSAVSGWDLILATGVAALSTAGNPCIGLLGPERAATTASAGAGV